MKVKWIVVIGVIVVVAIIGTIFALQGNENGELIPPIEDNNDEVVLDDNPYVDIPVGEVFKVEPNVVLDKAVAPAYYEFGNVSPGGLIDTWTKDGLVNLGGEEIGWRKDGQLWILLYNGKASSVTFSLEVINAPRETNHSDITGQDYSKAPEEFLGNVEVEKSVTVAPGSAVKVPVGIYFPVGVEYPDQWEFRILISTLEVPGTLATTFEPRFFTYMG